MKLHEYNREFPIKKCCDALKNAHELGMIRFLENPLLNTYILEWNDLQTKMMMWGYKCVFCGKTIKNKDSIIE